MQSQKTLLDTFGIVGLLGLGLLFARLLLGMPTIVGSIGLLLYLISLTAAKVQILHDTCFLQSRRASTWVLGGLSAIIILGIALGIPIIYASLSSTMVALVFALLLAGVYTYALVNTKYSVGARAKKQRGPSWHIIPFVREHYLWFVLYGGVWCIGIALLRVSVSYGAAFTSPWQSIVPLYLPIVFLAGLILLCLLFSRTKVHVVLFIILLQSILVHLYIPASHALPAGGDIWRHMGTVQHITTGGEVGPGLVGDTIAKTEVFGVGIPSVFVQPQQYAYSVQWGLMAATEHTSGLDMHTLSKWAMPLLWAIAIPIIFFYIGYVLFGRSRHGLFLSAATLVPFSFQALGSLMLPVTFGYLAFFMALLWLLFAIKYQTRSQWTLVSIVACSLFFVYPLHAIIFAFLVASSVVLFQVSDRYSNLIFRIISICIAMIGMSLLPIVELVAGMSVIPDHIDILAAIKSIVGEHTGWYIASEIRPHDILSGNILYNHVPSYSFVSNLFTSFRWHLVPMALLLYAAAGYGYIRALVVEKQLVWHIFAVLASIVWGGYTISWYFLAGDRQLVRRLDVLFAALLLIFGWYGVRYIFDHYIEHRSESSRATMVVFVLGIILTWSSITSFGLGPDMRNLSTDEQSAGAYIAESLNTSTLAQDCVLADTWTLLAVETYTAGRVQGGGFPLDAQYGQALRTELYSASIASPSTTLWANIGSTTEHTHCTLALPIGDDIDPYIDAYGTPTLIGDYGVWQEVLPK